jgi:hypothetical protein
MNVRERAKEGERCDGQQHCKTKTLPCLTLLVAGKQAGLSPSFVMKVFGYP